MKQNVLIFSGGGYNAVEIYFCLKDNLLFYPIGASSYSDHAEFLFKKSFNNLPFIWEENFLDCFNQLIEDENIQFIIPTHDTIALFLMENENKINAAIVCSPYETAYLCRHKAAMYQHFADSDFVPYVYNDIKEVQIYPVICKKDIGEGSRGIIKVNSKEELSEIRNISEYVICEYLPGDEITIDCFTDRHGSLRFSNARKRVRIINGISARSEVLPINDELKYILKEINDRVVFRGYWFVQLKKSKSGKYKLLEICTRFAGTFNLSKNMDVNLPLLALCDRAGMEVSFTPNSYRIVSDKTYFDRYKVDIAYERVYIDFDDTIVFNRKQYNTFVMMFIYQCLNNKIDLYLITKHEYNLDETMQKIKLNKGIFAGIINVPVDRWKYEFMDDSIESIFIDNCYQERKKVKEHLGFNTFDVCNIECLIEWG